MAQRHQKASSKQRSQLPRQTVENLRRALKREREQRKQALEQQTATADILKVISASPSDLQPVFDAIARSAQKLFGARAALVCRRINDVLHLAAHTATTEAGDANLRKLYPAKLTGEGAVGKAVLSGEPAFIIDVQTDPAYQPSSARGRANGGIEAFSPCRCSVNALRSVPST